jgi:hypothetical protein
VEQTFTVAEARALMPELLARADALVERRADLAELNAALQGGEPSALGGRPELKALEARVSEDIGWFETQGLQVKGVAPLLLDFRSALDGEPVLLCWLEGDRELDWYHRIDLGFLGRRRLPS